MTNLASNSFSGSVACSDYVQTNRAAAIDNVAISFFDNSKCRHTFDKRLCNDDVFLCVYKLISYFEPTQPAVFQVFEVDQALVLEYKRKILSRSSLQGMTSDKKLDGIGGARVIEVQANLGHTGWEDDLIKAGFDPSLPSAWILEGLTMYDENYIKNI